jgi:hypothetical protein
MWARLDDELLDHRKVFDAGRRLGPNGPAIALGMYAVALMWCNRQLTDGFIPMTSWLKFPHINKPLAVADALVTAGLFDRVEGGFKVHDFFAHNPSAESIKTKRREDALRKRAERAKHNGY